MSRLRDYIYLWAIIKDHIEPSGLVAHFTFLHNEKQSPNANSDVTAWLSSRFPLSGVCKCKFSKVNQNIPSTGPKHKGVTMHIFVYWGLLVLWM